MKKTMVTIEMTKTVNEQNEVQPNVYVVKKNDELITQTTDFVHAMQCFINRAHSD